MERFIFAVMFIPATWMMSFSDPINGQDRSLTDQAWIVGTWLSEKLDYGSFGEWKGATHIELVATSPNTIGLFLIDARGKRTRAGDSVPCILDSKKFFFGPIGSGLSFRYSRPSDDVLILDSNAGRIHAELRRQKTKAVQNTDWGSIKGRITWEGKLPELPPIALPDSPFGKNCLHANKGMPPPNETWVVHKENKGIKNTFVWLAHPEKKPIPIKESLKEIKIKTVEVHQAGCQFVPHALALREGQTLRVKNTSPFSHNFRWSGNPEVQDNFGGVLVTPNNRTHDVELKADRLPILMECNIHPWMRGYVRVFDHPYFAVTDDNGAFEINDAPAGNWRLMIWHGSAGWKGGAKGKNGEPIVIEVSKTCDLGSLTSYLITD